MLNGPALGLLNTKDDKRQQMQVSVQNGLIIVEFQKDTGWLALNREEAIAFIQCLADRLNSAEMRFHAQ